VTERMVIIKGLEGWGIGKILLSGYRLYFHLVFCFLKQGLAM
jgi:hypothetical protein